MIDCSECTVKNYGFCKILEAVREVSCPFRHEMKGKEYETGNKRKRYP